MKFETKSVFLPSMLANGTYSKDMEMDGSLPDYAPDIARLIRVDAKPSIPEITVNGNRGESVCRVEFGILYESDYKAQPGYITVNGELRQKFDCLESSGEPYPVANICCTYLTCKLLGPRRFVIRARMQSEISATGLTETKAVDYDSAPVAAFFRTEKASLKRCCGIIRESFRFEKTVSAETPIDRVIYAEAEARLPDVSVSDGRLTAAVPVTVRLIYTGEDGIYHSLRQTFTEDAETENETVEPGRMYRVKAAVTETEALPELNEYGEQRNVRLNIAMALEYMCYKDSERTYAVDGFCGDRASTRSESSAKCVSMCGIYGKSFVFEQTYETGNEDLGTVLDVSATVIPTEKSIEDGVVTVRGNIDAEVLTASSAGVASNDLNGTFEEQIEVGAGAAVTDVRVTVTDSSATVQNGNSIALRIGISLDVCVWECPRFRMLSELTADDTATAGRDGVVFYYPEHSESAWDVAKRYRKNPKKLIDDNRDIFASDGSLTDDAVFVRIR